MAQNDIQITTTPPLAGLTLVQGINGALQSLATDFAGSIDPAAIDGVGPYCTWADTGNGLLKRRNAAGTDWVVEAELFEQAARRNGDGTQNFNVASLNGGQLAGLRNRIINGDFSINQDGVTGTVTLVAGQYGHDMWKAGSGGCTYTFATTQNVTTITITAGSLIQIVEGLNLQSGTHVLSWIGTAQGKIGAGAFADSGVTGAAVGGTNLNIEFGAGTLSKVQLEPGTIATPFEHRFYGSELALCERYYRILTAGFSANVTSAGLYFVYVQLSPPMRATPTKTGTHLFANSFPATIEPGSLAGSETFISASRVASASGAGSFAIRIFADARL